MLHQLISLHAELRPLPSTAVYRVRRVDPSMSSRPRAPAPIGPKRSRSGTLGLRQLFDRGDKVQWKGTTWVVDQFKREGDRQYTLRSLPWIEEAVTRLRGLGGRMPLATFQALLTEYGFGAGSYVLPAVLERLEACVVVSDGHVELLPDARTTRGPVSAWTLTTNGASALHRAARRGLEAELAVLLTKKQNPNRQADNGRTALMEAAHEDHRECLQGLLDVHANPNLQDDNGRTALMEAAHEDHSECLQGLLDVHANRNLQDTTGRTAVSLAARQGNAACLELLLDSNANTAKRDLKGRTALMWAARFGHAECVRRLLARAQPNRLTDWRSDTGHTALTYAAQHGHTDCVRGLLAHRADPNVRTNHGKTGLYVAALFGHPECVRLLLASGADPQLVANDGKTPLEVGQAACVDLLEAHEAQSQERALQGKGRSALLQLAHTNPALRPAIRERLREVDATLDDARQKRARDWADRRLRLDQDSARQRSVLEDEWKQPPTPLQQAHAAKVSRQADGNVELQRALDRQRNLTEQLHAAAAKALDAELAVQQARLSAREANERAEASATAYDDDHRCVVCHNVFAALGVAFPCGHRTCAGCMLDLARLSPSCPLCREPWSLDRVRDIHAHL